VEHLRPVPDGEPIGSPSGGSRPGPDDLAALLGRAGRGDESAFATFYDATSSRAYGLALRVVRNPAHAEEVAQEAYLDAWRSSSRYDARLGSAAGWLLTTLTAAVTEAGLVDTLNSAEALTVFAPTDDAFAKIPEKDLNALLADKEALTTVLTHHVVAGQLPPEELAGEHETLAGDMITVEGSGEEFTAEGAAVICGNVPTANATVYVIDSVMMPAM